MSRRQKLPPTELHQDEFDLVTAFSVFSHLSEEAFCRWMIEFHKILKPGGIVCATTRNLRFARHCVDASKVADRSTYDDYTNALIGIYNDSTYPGIRQDYIDGRVIYHSLSPTAAWETAYYGETHLPPGYLRTFLPKHFQMIGFSPMTRMASCRPSLFCRR